MPALTQLLFIFIQNEFVRFQVCCYILFCMETELIVQEDMFVVVYFFSFKFAFEVYKNFIMYALNSVQVFV